MLVENAKAIEFALKTNKVLEELDISHNQLGEIPTEFKNMTQVR